MKCEQYLVRPNNNQLFSFNLSLLEYYSICIDIIVRCERLHKMEPELTRLLKGIETLSGIESEGIVGLTDNQNLLGHSKRSSNL